MRKRLKPLHCYCLNENLTSMPTETCQQVCYPQFIYALKPRVSSNYFINELGETVSD